jgi:translation elongation factor P/translation initiation factor 5A
MPRTWIEEGLSQQDLARRVDDALSQIHEIATKGIISDAQVKNSSRSYLYVDGDNLKFYNAKTKKTITVI